MGWGADAGPGGRRRGRPHLLGARRVTRAGRHLPPQPPVAAFASHPDTLLALDIKGEPLHLEHGFPARIIAPNRPGVLQTKWVSRITVSDPESS